MNGLLLLSGIVMSASGLLLQGYYHLQKNPDHSPLMGLNRTAWNAVHIWASAGFLCTAVYHVWVHREWYGAVLRGRLFSKFRMTLILTALVSVAALCGLIPLLMRYCEGSPAGRSLFIELHDKIAILLFIVAVGHVIKRRTWYLRAIKRK